jgi:hypothetical protein
MVDTSVCAARNTRRGNHAQNEQHILQTTSKLERAQKMVKLFDTQKTRLTLSEASSRLILSQTSDRIAPTSFLMGSGVAGQSPSNALSILLMSVVASVHGECVVKNGVTSFGVVTHSLSAAVGETISKADVL